MAAVTALSFSSCQLFEKTVGQKSKVKTTTVLPQDREAIQKKVNQLTYTPEEFSKGIVKGDWAIEEVNGMPAVGEKAPFLKFSATDGKVYGNNGCNTVNADYEYSPSAHTLRFSNVAVTMMLCHKEGITDIEINRALDATRSYTLEKNDEGYVLTFFDRDGEPVMVLTHQNFEFLNGTWKVIAIDGEEVNIEKMKLVFDVDEHKIHGNTGCNVLNGKLETDMDVPNSISFESIAVTMMLCPEMEYQTAMLVALEEACRAKPVDRDKVLFIDSNGRTVLTLQRTTDR